MPQIFGNELDGKPLPDLNKINPLLSQFEILWKKVQELETRLAELEGK